ncbi:MAG: hypothetical protein HFJ06_16550, partial [Lachnospiraceae bacterium]|nr:hypothetical protein [Lachnospiraceae bacterium]
MNEYTGAVTHIVSDVSYGGNFPSIDIRHVNNTSWKDQANAYGRGWLLNISEKLSELHNEKMPKYKYVYRDEDGTELYFIAKSSGSGFEDEVGRGLELAHTHGATYPYTITFKDGTKKKYNSDGYLCQIEYTDGKTTTITLSNNLPTKATDYAGRTVTFAYSGGRLSQLTLTGGRKVTYDYDSTGRLLKIHHYNGIVSEYAYDTSNRFVSVFNDTMRLGIDYYENHQLKALYEQPWPGGTAHYIMWVDYLKDKTIFTHPGPSNDISSTCSDRLLEHCLFNQYGQKLTSYLTSANQVETYGVECNVYTPVTTTTGFEKNNKLLTSYNSPNAQNYIRNMSFEDGTAQWNTNSVAQSIFSAPTSANDAYIGNRYGKLSRTSTSSTAAEVSQSIVLPAGTYTLSGYVRTTDVTGSGAYLQLRKGSGTTGLSSKLVTGTTTRSNERGWQKLSVTTELSSETNLTAIVALSGNSKGTVYFDCLQLERGDAANPPNLIANTNMENHLTSWSGSSALVSGVDTYTTAQAHSYGESYRLRGDIGSYKHITQWIPLKGKSTDTYILSGWAKGASLPKENNPESKFCLDIAIVYTDGTRREIDDVEFDRFVRDWQYVSKAFTVRHPDDASKIAERVEVYCVYDFNANNAYFDDIQLIKDVAPTYTYDDEGNMTSVKDLAEQKAEYEFANNTLVRTLNPTGSSYINTYSTNDKNRLLSSVANEVTYAYGYDSKGNVTRARAIATTPTSGHYYYLITGNGNLVVDLYQNNTTAGTKFIAYTPRKTPGQKIKLVSASGSYYTLRPSSDESKVLGIRNGSSANNAMIELQTYTGANSQLWGFRQNTDGSYQIYPKSATNMRLQSPKPVPGKDNDLILYGNNNGKQQKFILEAADDTDSAYMESTATYSTSGAYPASITTMDGTTSMHYDEAMDRLSIAYDAYARTQYNYTNGKLDYSVVKNDLKTAAQIGKVDYKYTGERLTQIISPGATYNFGYDAYGNRLTTKVGSKTLMTNSYRDYNGCLEQSTYGNGHWVGYDYDHLNRLQQINKWTGSDVWMYSWEYDVWGNINKLFESDKLRQSMTTHYVYDSIGRLNRFERSDGYSGEVTYDAKNRLNSSIYMTSDGSRSVEYTYDEAIGQVDWAQTDGFQWNNYYDGLNRLDERLYNLDNYSFSVYYNYRTNGKRTDGRVESVIFNDEVTYYEYDAAGNITGIEPWTGGSKEYEYDGMGRLYEERDPTNGTLTYYEYNDQGNLYLTATHEYYRLPNGEWTMGSSIDSQEFNYDDTGWKDKLTRYYSQADGKTYTLTYDAIGNPLQYRSGMAMTWQNGRELATLTRTNSASSLDKWEYAYDVNGQRRSKTEKHATSANGSWTTKKTTQYYYDGIKLVAEKKGGTIVWYDYDETGSPVGMRVNGQDYLFKKNIQGDIEGLYNSYGEEVVTYTYNAWGKVTEVSGDLASTVGEYNSLRYRGYYYDSDTGLYYLNSRYYDPETCRFVNADGYNSTGQGIIGNNMYAYCGYNPIN